MGWSDVTVICGHIKICMLWGNTAYFMKLSGEHFSHYSDKIESVDLRKCPVLLRKWCHSNKHFSELAPHHGSENSWHRLCHCHPMHVYFYIKSVVCHNCKSYFLCLGFADKIFVFAILIPLRETELKSVLFFCNFCGFGSCLCSSFEKTQHSHFNLHAKFRLMSQMVPEIWLLLEFSVAAATIWKLSNLRRAWSGMIWSNVPQICLSKI